MTQRKQKVDKIKIWGEYIGTHDSTWGCLHMMRKIGATQILVLQARREDLRFYMSTRKRGESRVTLITVHLASYPHIGIALQKAEKPLYLCPECQSRLARHTHHHQCVTIHAYPRA